MPEERQEFVKIEGGFTTGGTVVFEEPFTVVPKVCVTPVTNKIISCSITGGNKNGFTYQIKERASFFYWKDSTATILVSWIAIQEK